MSTGRKAEILALLMRRIAAAEEKVRASLEYKETMEDVYRQLRDEGSHPQGKTLAGLEGPGE